MAKNYDSERHFQALAKWLSSRLEQWRNHRNNNYLKPWDEYYRLWRGQWTIEDKKQTGELDSDIDGQVVLS